jgi:hypothetical protein
MELLELAVDETGEATIDVNELDDVEDEDDEESKEDPGVLGEVLTDEEVGVVPLPAVPEGATLS